MTDRTVASVVEEVMRLHQYSPRSECCSCSLICMDHEEHRAHVAAEVEKALGIEDWGEEPIRTEQLVSGTAADGKWEAVHYYRIRALEAS